MDPITIYKVVACTALSMGHTSSERFCLTQDGAEKYAIKYIETMEKREYVLERKSAFVWESRCGNGTVKISKIEVSD